jgi:F-type H+-transporting ATPase subunit b
MTLQAVAALLGLIASEGGGGGLTDIDWVLTRATIVLFLLFAFVLGKFAWKPLLDMVESRETSVREQVEGAQKAQTEAQALLQRRQEELTAAAREREELIGRAQKEAEQVRAELVGKARGEAEVILEKAKQQIQLEKNRAVQELRSQVADLAVEAASRIVESSLTPEAQRKLVDDYIRALPQARQ